jgi:hypothetical protein
MLCCERVFIGSSCVDKWEEELLGFDFCMDERKYIHMCLVNELDTWFSTKEEILHALVYNLAYNFWTENQFMGDSWRPSSIH